MILGENVLTLIDWYGNAARSFGMVHPETDSKFNMLSKAIEAEIAERVAEADKVAVKIIDGLQAKLAEAKSAIPAPEHLPFDLEAAKRGEPIERRNSDGSWSLADFVGTCRNDTVVIWKRKDDLPSWNTFDMLRMAPRPMRTVWLNIPSDKGGAYGYKSEEDARADVARSGKTPFAIAYPVQVPAK